MITQKPRCVGKEVGRPQRMVFLAKETTSTKALRTTEEKGLPKVSTLLLTWLLFAAASTSQVLVLLGRREDRAVLISVSLL